MNAHRFMVLTKPNDLSIILKATPHGKLSDSLHCQSKQMSTKWCVL